MALPYVTVTGTYVLPSGAPATGTVRFTLIPAVRIGSTTLSESSVTVTLDETGAFSVPLLANTDPSVTPAGSYYAVAESIASARGAYAVVVPHDAGATVALASLAPTIPGPVQTAYALQSALLAHAALTTTAHGGLVASTDARLTDPRTPTGAAGGVLSGTYPNPDWAADMATQAALDAEASTRAGADSTHAALTTTAHGGIVAGTDSRLTDARPPTAHANTHASAGSDPVTPGAIGAATSGHTHTGMLSPGQALGVALQTGSRYYTNSSASIATSATNGNGTLRVSRFDVDRAVTVDRIAVDITGAGETGSVVRLGIYADTNGVPGALLLDAGTVAGDGPPALKEATVNQALAAGVYWLGAVVQNAPTTQPTLRVCAGVVPTTQASPISTLSQTWGGYSMTGVTGALGAFTSPPAFAVTVPRIALRIV